MEVFQKFHTQAVFEKSLNTTFLALIPKKENAVEIKDFGPISLVGGILKTGIPGVLCKLDVEKAYDHVNWGFLIPSNFFGSSRGIRQGDPLSLLLFDIIIEALSHMLDMVAAAGQFSGFSLVTLREILNRFEDVSGLRINLGKSDLVPVGEVRNLDVLVGLLDCRHSSLLLKYLGLPLGAKFKESSIWNPILEKME
nr:uncharacterized protein LOC111984390 [Quercus suber]